MSSADLRKPEAEIPQKKKRKRMESSATNMPGKRVLCPHFCPSLCTLSHRTNSSWRQVGNERLHINNATTMTPAALNVTSVWELHQSWL